jgi:integrase
VGCRRGELLALQWQDVDFETGLMNVTKSLEQTKLGGLRVKPPKSGKPRRFAVPAAALAALSEHRVEQHRDREVLGVDYEEHDLVFCVPSGGYYSPNCAGIRVAKLMKKVGLASVSLHSLRHSHASELISKGVPITTVAKRLGHANANITVAIYAHALEADELAAAKVWDDAMAGVIAASKKAGAPRMLAIVSRKAG